MVSHTDITERHSAEEAVQLSHARVQELAGRLINLQEEERRRIAAELHDGLGQSLAIIRNRASICLRDLADKDLVSEQLEEISATASAAVDEVRVIAHDLRPYELDRVGLGLAIESMVKKVAEATRLELSTSLDGIEGLLSPEAETGIYRIVQEALNNMVNHAGATEGRIALKRIENELLIVVKDNGKGMVPVTSTNGHGHGLTGIAERARMLGGTLSIDSKPGQGTVLSVRVGGLEKTYGQ